MSAQPESEGGGKSGEVGEDPATADGRTSTRSRAAQGDPPPWPVSHRKALLQAIRQGK